MGPGPFIRREATPTKSPKGNNSVPAAEGFWLVGKGGFLARDHQVVLLSLQLIFKSEALMNYLVQLKLRGEPFGHNINQSCHITAVGREVEKKNQWHVQGDGNSPKREKHLMKKRASILQVYEVEVAFLLVQTTRFLWCSVSRLSKNNMSSTACTQTSSGVTVVRKLAVHLATNADRPKEHYSNWQYVNSTSAM